MSPIRAVRNAGAPVGKGEGGPGNSGRQEECKEEPDQCSQVFITGGGTA